MYFCSERLLNAWNTFFCEWINLKFFCLLTQLMIVANEGFLLFKHTWPDFLLRLDWKYINMSFLCHTAHVDFEIVKKKKRFTQMSTLTHVGPTCYWKKRDVKTYKQHRSITKTSVYDLCAPYFKFSEVLWLCWRNYSLISSAVAHTKTVMFNPAAQTLSL